jgi:hypothetical protein
MRPTGDMITTTDEVIDRFKDRAECRRPGRLTDR